MATPPEPVTDAKALLDAANRASEKVAALHIAFLAVCTYVVVIVFSTTDMDLLIGKGIKLPVVAVDVPILGFYATAPYFWSWSTSISYSNYSCYRGSSTLSTAQPRNKKASAVCATS